MFTDKRIKILKFIYKNGVTKIEKIEERFDKDYNTASALTWLVKNNCVTSSSGKYDNGNNEITVYRQTDYKITIDGRDYLKKNKMELIGFSIGILTFILSILDLIFW